MVIFVDTLGCLGLIFFLVMFAYAIVATWFLSFYGWACVIGTWAFFIFLFRHPIGRICYNVKCCLVGGWKDGLRKAKAREAAKRAKRQRSDND